MCMRVVVGEAELLRRITSLSNENKVWRSYIGMGYYNCFMPPTIQRNILENPGWWDAYNYDYRSDSCLYAPPINTRGRIVISKHIKQCNLVNSRNKANHFSYVTRKIDVFKTCLTRGTGIAVECARPIRHCAFACKSNSRKHACFGNVCVTCTS